MPTHALAINKYLTWSPFNQWLYMPESYHNAEVIHVIEHPEARHKTNPYPDPETFSETIEDAISELRNDCYFPAVGCSQLNCNTPEAMWICRLAHILLEFGSVDCSLTDHKNADLFSLKIFNS